MGKTLKKLVLLHSNDMHGDFLTEEIDDHLVGGVSMLSGYINKVRMEERNVIYAIAGDMFRGSIIDSEFQGLSTIEIMNMLAPDIVTLGNHEVDYGLAHLLFIEKCASFPIINANLHVQTNGARLFNPYKIIEIDGMKILFIGILTEEVLAMTKKDGLIGTFVNINEAAEEVGRICNAYNSLDIDFTVLLTHIGFEEDKKLAAMLDPAWGVDVIIGGHSHTLPDEPAVVNNIPIVQAGVGTDNLGRFDVMIDTDNNCIDSFEWKTIPITSANCPRDEALEEVIHKYKSQTDAKYNRIVTKFLRQLTHPIRTRETELGDLFADALRESFGVDIFLLGSGSIRVEQLGPVVTLAGLKEAFPYDDQVYSFEVTGAQLRHMLTYMVRDEVWEGVHCEFYQLSEGMKAVYNQATHSFSELSLNGEPIDDERLYTIGMQNFHFINMGDIFNINTEEVFANRKPRIISSSCIEVLQEYFSSRMHIDSEGSGRLILNLLK